MELISRDIGTGYHIPQGILASYGPKEDLCFKNNLQIIETDQICPTILNNYGLKIPKYMNKPVL